MAATITKRGLAMFIVGTSKLDILNAIVNQRYPSVKGFFYNAADATYHLIAEVKQYCYLKMTDYDLSIIKGNSKNYRLAFETTSGDALDITGYTVFFTVKKNVNQTDDQAIISKTNTTNIS